MKKILVSLLVCCLVFVGLDKDVNAYQNFDAGSKYAIAVDLNTGEIRYQKNAYTKMNPASITKIITAIVAIKNITDLQEQITITEADLDVAFEELTVCGFEVGEVLTYEQLLYAMMFFSGADACLALANHVFGSEANMMVAMNAYVKSLGLTKTNFTNNVGYTETNHYTTAYDMYVLTKDAIKNATFYKIFTSQTYSSGEYSWKNESFYMNTYYGVPITDIIGAKSGRTNAAQYCYASLCNVNGNKTIIVTGYQTADYSKAYGKTTVDIIAYLIEKEIAEAIVWEDVKVYDKNQLLNSLIVFNAKDDVMFDAYASEDIIVTVPDTEIENLHDMEIIYSFEELHAPIYLGDMVGTFTIWLYEEELYTGNIMASRQVIDYYDETMEEVEEVVESNDYTTYIILGLCLILVITGGVFAYKKINIKKED